MLQYFPNITGSLTVSGDVIVSGSIATTQGITISGSIDSASYSSNSEKLDNLDSTAFVFTSSFNTYSSSMSTRVGKIEGNYATTGSNIFTGAQTVCANITSTGTIIAQTLNVQQVTSSIVYSSGSNIFGNQLTDIQQFTGSVRITGSVCATGNSCFANDVFVYGDLRMQGTDSFIWSPSGSPTGFTGFYDGTNNQISLVVCNNSGHLLLQPQKCNVGVGVSNPGQKLEVAGIIHSYDRTNGVVDGAFYASKSGGSTSVIIRSCGITHFNGGNVGIGTDTPITKLQICTTATAENVINITNGTQQLQLGVNTTDGGSYVFEKICGLRFGTADIERMRITSCGNVLIGSSTVSTGYSRLSLVGGEPSGTGPNSGVQFTYNASTYGGGAITTVNAAGGGISFWTFTGNVGSESYSERMRITSAGRVGIGTCNPTEYKLQVEGTDSYTGIKVKNTNSASGVWGILDIRNNCNDGLQIGVVGNAGYSTSTNFYNATYIESYNQRLNLRTYNDFGITIGTNSNVRMCILNTGEAVFACQVCAPSGIRFAGGSLFCNYETSTWTPFISNLSTQPTVSYSSRTGTYTRIGNMVYVFWDITVSSLSGGSGPALICNLPFTVSSNMAGYSVGQYRDATLIAASGGAVLKGFAERGQSYIYLQYDYTGACGFGSTPTGVTFNSSGRITGYIIYQV